ncbi:MAG: type I glyceraldehyde-3-phosphate dehydrogenase [Actinomycetota bacterium]|jgi:glyceraldehyde 3-phosphate dehydrogenase|nr:type I glyceraldehyde-3-phosphate dehydrogenase [Actinomycetota bacterium]
MAVRVGVNGYGRIGRSFHRALLDRGESAGVELVAVNDPFGDSETMAFLLKHDSVGGTIPNEVKVSNGGFSVDGKEVKKLEVREPAEIPWGDHGIDVVIESTGVFTARDAAAGHLQGGAKKVIISAPSGDADVTLCIGVNDDAYDPAKHQVVSNASCTTNCLAPLAKVLLDRFGVEQGFMTTIHSYTSDQALQDIAQTSRKGKADLRRMRAAALSIIPASTGAAKAIGLVLPELKGKLDGTSMRVPTPTGSITDLVAVLNESAGVDDVNEAFAAAANDASYKGVLTYTDEPLVSADIVGDPASCIFSAKDTMANGKMVKVLGWYDNEWGFSNRLVDLAAFLGES